MPEIRVHREGTLRWVQASASLATSQTGPIPSGAVIPAWATASAAQTGLIGYVQAGFEFVQPAKYETVPDRGVPRVHKLVAVEAGKATFTVLFGITADYPSIITSSGVSTPQIHLEFRQQEDEIAAGSAVYFQLLNVVQVEKKLTEEAAGNKLAFSVQFLSAVGPTASGYIA